MSRNILSYAFGIAACMVFTASSARAAETGDEPVAVELCLAVDGSGSIGEDEFTFQRRAYADAITSKPVLDTIASTYSGTIAIALMEWGGPDSMNPIVGWTRIGNAQEAQGFADAVVAAPRKAVGWNSISNAIDFCQNWMAKNAYDGQRRIIDVSGDSGQHGGMPLEVARRNAVEDGIVINALALNYRGSGLYGSDTALEDHFRAEVIGGTGSFALTVDREDQFVKALTRKLVLELAAR
ncbi:DUF1194 domain-containing protein [Pararhizobium mangrovi]|uniref:DUF1194 domain-containing protein n=1 Tax=Pararhizobium mangrovi TaxID=2590452 RepID=A0A506UHD7_9HYPH|nr:DUF1194 domain-containing protein [Pararhizobium mangrovi]TPW32718.1 DUF1194 domain-containing protein [Pararhizobium mangrovi]